MNDNNERRQKRTRENRKLVQFWVDPQFLDDIRELADNEYDGNVALTVRMVLRKSIEARKAMAEDVVAA